MPQEYPALIDGKPVDGNKWFYGNGELKKPLPKACVKACSHSGSCDNDVKYYQKELAFLPPSKQMAIDYLEPFGAWTLAEMEIMSIEELAQKILWLACSNIMEDNEWLGLVH